jgi:tetratricopeptide (TPR) repeat protein
MGTLFEKLDQPEKADAAYRKTIETQAELQPRVRRAREHVHRLRLRKRGDGRAARQARRSTTRTRACGTASAARTFVELGRDAEAIDAYSKAKAIDPDGSTRSTASAWPTPSCASARRRARTSNLFLQKAGGDTPPHVVKAAQDTLQRMNDVL